MNSVTRMWALACGAGIVAVLAGGWFIGVQPQLATASASASAVTSVDAQNQATQIKLTGLTKAAAKIDTLRTQDDTLQKAVPTILKPNTFVRRINEVAALDGVKVAAVTLGDAAAYTAATGSSGSGAIKIAAVDPSITAADFASIPASIQVTGTPDALFQFAHDIQNDERVFDIDNVQTSTNDDGSVTGTFAGSIFTLKR